MEHQPLTTLTGTPIGGGWCFKRTWNHWNAVNSRVRTDLSPVERVDASSRAVVYQRRFGPVASKKRLCHVCLIASPEV